MGNLYLQHEYGLAFSQLLLAMLGMGATLRLADFVEIAKLPKALIAGLSIQLLLVPAIAFSLMKIFNLAPGVAIGLAIIAAIPGGTTSNIYTYFAKGHVALSITITSLSTVACLFTVPAILQLLIAPYVPNDFSLPVAKIAVETALAILLPLAVGMLILKITPAYAAYISRWAIRASLGIIVLIIIGASSSGRLDWSAFGFFSASILSLFAFLLLISGLVVPKILSLPTQDAIAIDMEVTVRNINLAVLIIASLFPAANTSTLHLGNDALFTVLAYGALMMAPAGFLIIGHRYFLAQNHPTVLGNKTT